ncbi:MAG: GntR family transcriptional regulator, partial [Spirochaetia bacterium]|nr:GntR family transcriptional regulator [Spirochaetia bacterium]
MEIPKYRELKYRLYRDIQARKWVPHQKLPSERDLAAEFGVNEETARRALREMEAEGMVYRLLRRGSFVSPPSKKQQLLIVTLNPFFLNAWDSTIMHFYAGILESTQSGQETSLPLIVDTQSFVRQVEDIDLVYKDLAGVIFYRHFQAFRSTHAILDRKKIPNLFYGSDAYSPYIRSGNTYLYQEEAICSLVLNRLWRKDVERLAMIYPKNHPVLRKRHEIFLSYLKKKSVPLKKTDVLALENPEEYFLRQNGEAKLIDWLRPMAGKKYGIFAGGDRYAIHITNAAYRNGFSIPRDFSLVG